MVDNGVNMRYTMGKSITYVSKSILIQLRDEVDRMIKNYIEYNLDDIDKKDYKYSKEWEEIQRGNDYY